MLPEDYDTEGYDGVGEQGADGHHVHELLKVEDGCHHTCYHVHIKLVACTDSLLIITLLIQLKGTVIQCDSSTLFYLEPCRNFFSL